MRARIDARLQPAIQLQAGVGDFHDESRGGRMVGQKVAGIATHDRDVGFRFGIGPEPKRKLDADTPARSKRLAQGFTGQVDRRGMRSVLRLGDDESSFQELDRIVFVEHADVDQPAVLPTGPASCSDRGLGHCRAR